MNTMVLDDDYYYVEFQDGSGNNSLVMKEHVDEMMMEENTDFEMDVDIESVQVNSNVAERCLIPMV